MAEPSRAVFLSYASQDAEAAQRICEALRAAGIEVWFDQSELRGGDVWDQAIRRQIKACALFIPVISRHTHERREGYFRLEWKLAVDRSNLISATQAFLVPVVIDDTREDDEEVPERIRDVHWTRLPGGETPPAFVERVQRLLLGEVSKTIGVLSPAREHASASSRSKRTLPLTVAGAAAVALLVVLGIFGLERLRGSKPGVQGESIAVLPLTNEGGNASEQYFADGISEDLITALGQFAGLKVIGRSSAFQFRDSKEDSHSIGAKLGVAHLLEGSVRRAGDTVRISAELIDTRDGSMQWSERYDRPYKDLFALQDEITHAVVAALRVKLLPSEHAAEQSERPPSGSLEAYNAWLQGNFYHRHLSEAGFRKAIEYFTQATQIDPRYARAWSSLAVAWINLGNFLPATPAQDAHAKAREAAGRALTIAPDSADAHRARGAVLLYTEFDWRGAETEFRRALALAPNDGTTKCTYGIILSILGEPEKAVGLTQQALATDPLRPDWYEDLAGYLFALNRLDEAERAIRRVIELQPAGEGDYALLTMIEIKRGDAQAALAAAQQEHPGPIRDFALVAARQIGNDRAAADTALSTLIAKYANDGAYGIADLYALRNDAKSTFEWLDRAWNNRDSDIARLLSDPFILRYQDDPRFDAFCKKVGLPTPAEVGKRT